MFFIVTAHTEHIAGLLADLCSRVIPLLTIYHCSTDSPINEDFFHLRKIKNTLNTTWTSFKVIIISWNTHNQSSSLDKSVYINPEYIWKKNQLEIK